ncbi:unnamed protein product, partial [Staurois parvus]
MICVAPAVLPVSVNQCQLSVPIHATCQCPSMPPASVHHATSSVHPCHLLSIHATCQCPPMHLPVSTTYHQCPSHL